MLITNARTGTHAPHAPTPGPWHAQGRYIVPAGDGPSIGSAVALKAPSLKKQPDYDAQAVVNARLMAAAPAMYDALTHALALIRDPDADEYQANAVENLISDIVSDLQRPY